MRPHACHVLKSYTLCFNVVFYITLWWGLYRVNTPHSRAVWKGVAVHVLPFWVASQYLMWGTHMWRKCGAPLPLALLSDLVLHWLPLIVMLRHVYRAPEPPAWSGVLLVVGVAVTYTAVAAAATGGNVRAMYDVPLPTLLALYLPVLLLAYLAFQWWE
jgi:hypothetical protein